MPLIKGLVYKMISQNHKTKINYGRFINTLKSTILERYEEKFGSLRWLKWREILSLLNLCGGYMDNNEKCIYYEALKKYGS